MCPDTGVALSVERWRAPLRPLRAGRCANCGGVRASSGACTDCGLAHGEDANLHEDMASHLGCSTLCEAAEKAAKAGGHVLAIKLATAAFHHTAAGPRARLLRLRELVRAEVTELAAEEAGDWVLQGGSPVPAITETLSRAGSRDAAIAVLDKAIRARRDPTLLLLRARFYLQDGAYSVAAADAVVAATQGPSHVTKPALALLEEAVDALHAAGHLDTALAVIDAAASRTHREPGFTFRVACMHEERGELAAARKWFVHTLRIDREHRGARARLPAIEDRLGVASTMNSLG
ncbi:MAG TPA: hypothetical protein QGF58_30085 [Myxococcota bacterium]|nr:hypothetical protein [Myxococcota bacterium]